MSRACHESVNSRVWRLLALREWIMLPLSPSLLVLIAALIMLDVTPNGLKKGEGGTFRRETTQKASSLSIAQHSGGLPGFEDSGVTHRFWRCSGSRESIHATHQASCVLSCSTEG